MVSIPNEERVEESPIPESITVQTHDWYLRKVLYCFDVQS